MSALQAGQIVNFRRRLWRVDEVLGEQFVASTIDGLGDVRRRFLTALERPEPAALGEPDYTQLGDPQSQDLLLRAYRLSMLHGSAPFLSLQRSSVIPVNYQLVPLVMALEQPRVRMLIADDVGSGKTIEAGLILSELLARGRVKRFLVITPASLREQWQEALDYLFHLETRILSGQTRREYEKELPAGANPWQYFDRVIVSIDYAKQPHTKLQILEQPWDLVLVDEAHQAAKPHQVAANQSVDMDRWQLVKDLAEQLTTHHLLLLTATPHNGYRDSFASLLSMLDPRVVAGPVHDPEIHRRVARRYVCQRSRKDVQAWFQEQGIDSPFPTRDHDEDIIPLHNDMAAALDEVRGYSNRLLSQAARTKRGRTISEWLALHLQKRGLSSPAALRISLQNRLAEVQRQRQEAEESTGARTADREAIRGSVFDLDPGERTDPEEASRRADRTLLLEFLGLQEQERLLERALAQAKKVTPRKDTKLQHLLTKTLPRLLRLSPKLIVFTRYKDTLDYLVKEIPKTLKEPTILSLHGDLSEAARREEFKKFETTRSAVLVATDVISEGLNLQHACSQIVHYELPWNPNRLEQRNGRVDRFGQQAEEVVIRTLVMDDSLDVAILELLIKKAVRIRKDRGFCPPYFGDEVTIAHLIRSHQAGIQRRTGRQLKLFGETADAVEEALHRRLSDPLDDETVDRIAEDSFYGEVEVSLPDIEARLKQSHELIGSPAQIESFVRSALGRHRCQVRDEKDGSLTLVLPESRLQLPGIGAKLEKATFDPHAALADPDLTVLDIGHPLVRRLIELVREDFFTAGHDPRIARIDANGKDKGDSGPRISRISANGEGPKEGQFAKIRKISGSNAVSQRATNGRTAAIVTHEVDEVTILYHYLVRFIVNTKQPTVIEEMIPVAYPVYGETALSEDAVEQLLNAKPQSRVPSPQETTEHYQEAATSQLRTVALQTAIERRQAALVRERRELKEKLEQEGDAEIQEWLEGIDSLTVASQDLLTATLYLPR